MKILYVNNFNAKDDIEMTIASPRFYSFFCWVLFLFLAACGGGGTEKTIVDLSLDPINVNLKVAVGETVDLNVLALYDDKTEEELTENLVWSSDNDAIASVSEDGVITGVSTGATKVTATYDGTLSVSIDVIVGAIDPATIKSLTISPSEPVELVEGLSQSLVVVASFNDGSNTLLTTQVDWRSSDELVASVNAGGVVTGVAPSDDEVTITANIGEFEASVKLKIIAATITKIELSPKSISIVPGAEIPFRLLATYNNGTRTPITEAVEWSSEDNNIATVTETGVATAKNSGAVSISARYQDVSYNALLTVLGDSFSQIIDGGDHQLFTEAASEDDPTIESPMVEAFVDNTSRWALDNKDPGLKIRWAKDYIFLGEKYKENMEFVIPGVELKTYYADDNLDVSFQSILVSGSVYPEKLTLTRVDTVGGYIEAQYSYWLCNSDYGCKYYEGEIAATRIADRNAIIQGTPTEPVDLGQAPFGVNDNQFTVDKSNYSYYAIDVSPGTYYQVYLRAARSIRLEVYDDAGYTSLLCDAGSQYSPNCGVTPSGSQLYFRVKNEYASYTGNSYSIQVRGYVSEGTIATPIDLGDAPVIKYHGQALSGEYSYYRVDVQEKTYYKIAAYFNSYASNNTYVRLYRDDAFSSSICSYYSDGSCEYVTQAGETSLYIRADGRGNGSAYLLSIVEGDFKAEGTASSPLTPAQDSNGNYYLYGEVDNSASYYALALNSGQNYAIRLTNLFDNADLHVYSNAAFTSEICSSNNTGSTTEQCNIDNTSDYGVVYVKVDGSHALDVGGTSYRIETSQFYTSQGSLGDPINLGDTNVLGYSATVGNVDDSFYKVSLQPNTAYQVTLGYQTSYASLVAYRSSDFSSDWACSTSTSSGDEPCNLVTGIAAETFYIRVHRRTPYGSSFTINVVERVYEVQGSQVTPVDLGSLPINNFVGEVNVDSSYYQVTLGAGLPYAISLANLLDDADLYIYSDPDFTVLVCSSLNAGLDLESCVIPSSLSDQTLYIRVTGENAISGGSDYRINIGEYYSSEGAEGAEIDLVLDADPPHRGTVGIEGEYSYYQIDLDAYSAYTLRLDNQTNYTPMQMSDDPTFAGWWWRYPNSDYYLSTTNTAQTYYFRVVGVSPSGAAYDLSVDTRVFTPNGTLVDPVDMVAAPIEYFYSEVDTTESFYKIHLVAGETYRFRLSNDLDNADLYVYEDSGFSSLVCSSTEAGTTVDECALTAPLGGFAYIKVDGSPIISSGNNYNGTSYSLVIKRELASEGTVVAPVVLPDVPTSGTIGSVSNSSLSYYQVSGLTPGTQYLIKVIGARDESIRIHAYDNADYSSSPLCTSAYAYTNLNAFCLSDAVTTSTLYFAIDGGSTMAGSDYKLQVVEAPGTEGDIVTPVNLGTAPVINEPGQVASVGESYYSVSVSPGTRYLISLNGGSTNLNLYVYNDSGFTSAVICDIYRYKSCTYTPQSGETTLYLKTKGAWSVFGSLYNINVTAVPGSQGSSSSPYALGAAPFADLDITTGENRRSYYAVPVSPNTEYSIRVENFVYEGYLYMYEDSTFNNGICFRYSGNQNVSRCDYTTKETDSMLYFYIYEYSDHGQHLKVSVEEAP